MCVEMDLSNLDQINVFCIIFYLLEKTNFPFMHLCKHVSYQLGHECVTEDCREAGWEERLLHGGIFHLNSE